MDLNPLLVLSLLTASFVTPCLAQSPASTPLPPSVPLVAPSMLGWGGSTAVRGGGCAEADSVANANVTTVFDNDAGGREFGQSFTAPCTGLVEAIWFVVHNTGTGFPSDSATVNLLLFDGAGTSGALIASESYTARVPPVAGSFEAHRVGFSADVEVVGGRSYTFFVDQIDGDIQIAASNSNSYAGGGMYFTDDGDPSSATLALERWDLTFRVDLLPPVATANEGTGRPGTFEITAVYPNPLRTSATVTFEVPEVAHVRLAVYDVLGREVAVLADGALAAGTHELTLDGRRLPSGVYTVRATGAGLDLVRRVTVLR